MNGADVSRAVGLMRDVLLPAVATDWTVAAGSLDWSCWQTAEHVAHDLLAYAGQVAAQPLEAYLPFDLVVRPDATPEELLTIVEACATLLRRTLEAAPSTMRGWHWGPTDTTGFAAMGVNEILVHTWDITQGLDIVWQAPADLFQRTIDRLVRTPPAGNPFDVLLWATGRSALDDDHPRQGSWTFRVSDDS